MRNFILSLALLLPFLSFGQGTVRQVLVLNEGRYDYFNQTQAVPVTVGRWSPSTRSYAVVDTIEGARFASHLLVTDNHYYIAADNQLLKYDLLTHQLLASRLTPGIRKIAVAPGMVIVTRGEYQQKFEAYVQAFDDERLQPLFQVDTLSGIQYASEGIVVKNGFAWVAVNNGFEFGKEVGKIARINLSTGAYAGEIDLGPDGKNPDNLMLAGDQLFTLNNKDYTGSSISTYDFSSNRLVTTNLSNVSSGCGTSAFYRGVIHYQELGNTRLSQFDTRTSATVGERNYQKQFYGLAFDPINRFMYATETDFTNYGRMHVYDGFGLAVDSFEVGVAPGHIAFDIQQPTGLGELRAGSLSVWPQPAGEVLRVHGPQPARAWQVSELSGRVMLRGSVNAAETFEISLGGLSPGFYLLSVQGDGWKTQQKIARR